MKGTGIRMVGVGVAALTIAAALLAFQYFFVFLGLLGYGPEPPPPVTTADKVDCFRSIVFLGPRYTCPEGFLTQPTEGPTLAAVNLLGALLAPLVLVLVGGARRFRQLESHELFPFAFSVILALPFLPWALVSSVGFLLSRTLSN